MKTSKTTSLLEEATKQMNAGKFSRAFTLLKDLLAKDPTHHEGRRLLATLLLKFGNLVTAKNAFDSLLKEAFQHRDYELAESLLKEYLAVGHRCTPFIEMLGEVYEGKGDPIAAVIEYEKAIKILIDDSDSEGTSHARELYTKIKSLAPNSFVVGRLAPKFEVPSQPSTNGATDTPRDDSPSFPITPEPTPVAMLVSDAIAAPTAPSLEEPVQPSDLSSSPTEREDTDPTPVSTADMPPPHAIEDTPAPATPLQFATSSEIPPPAALSPSDSPVILSSPQPSTPSESIIPTSAAPESHEARAVTSTLRYATPDDSVAPPAVDRDTMEDARESPSFRFASDEHPTTSTISNASPQEEEKVPFPPVNQMPDSALVEEEKKVAELNVETGSDLQSKETLEARPFWDKIEEPSSKQVDSEKPEDMIPPPSPIEAQAVEPPIPEPVQEPIVTTEVALPIQGITENSSPKPTEVPLITKETIQELDPRPAQETIQEPPPSPGVFTEEPWALAASTRTPAEDDRPQVEPAPPTRSRRRDGPSLMMRVRIRVSILVRRCVTTAGSVTRLVLFLTGAAVALAFLSVGATAVVWLGLEEKPSEGYQEMLKVTPPRLVEDPQANGYLLLLGFEATPQINPLQEGHDRWLSPGTRIDESCTRPEGGTEGKQALVGWFRSTDPANQMKSGDGRLQEWITSESVSMGRYRQWLGLSFDDWGYGYMGSPDCAHVLRVHQLYMADGFSQDLTRGLDRLETDLTAWRTVLAQAKTLTMKAMAAEAVQDDVAVMSGLLTRPNLENRALQRITRLARPLDPDERSLRWPMQNEFVLEVKRAEARLRARSEEDPAVSIAIKKMPVPKQRTLNAYAKYYDALIKTPQAKGSVPPKLYDFARTPARTRMDSWLNPLDNLLRNEPAPDWERQINVIMEADARLRLVGLQTRLRGVASAQQISAKIAQAGPAFFDPFTELPMLLNVAQGRLYSVGRDGKDDSGDPTFDIGVPIAVKGL